VFEIPSVLSQFQEVGTNGVWVNTNIDTNITGSSGRNVYNIVHKHTSISTSLRLYSALSLVLSFSLSLVLSLSFSLPVSGLGAGDKTNHP
jgi:hypothetical protein